MIASVTIWILIAFGHGSYVTGNATVIEKFNTRAACLESLEQATKFNGSMTRFVCISAKDIYKDYN